MSYEAVKAIWEHSAVEGAARLTLLAVGHHADEYGVCWPSVGRLTSMTKLDRSTVMRSLRRLEKAGELQRHASQGEVNVYVLALPGLREIPAGLEACLAGLRTRLVQRRQLVAVHVAERKLARGGGAQDAPLNVQIYLNAQGNRGSP